MYLQTVCYAFLTCFLVALSACATCKSELEPITIEESIVSEAVKKPEKIYDGSLFRENGELCDLFMDPKARRVGDIITINIVETSSASNQADTNTSRSTSISAR